MVMFCWVIAETGDHNYTTLDGFNCSYFFIIQYCLINIFRQILAMWTLAVQLTAVSKWTLQPAHCYLGEGNSRNWLNIVCLLSNKMASVSNDCRNTMMHCTESILSLCLLQKNSVNLRDWKLLFGALVIIFM